MADINCRCQGKGWYLRTPDGFNPFNAGGFATARAMYKVTCTCEAAEPDASKPSGTSPIRQRGDGAALEERLIGCTLSNPLEAYHGSDQEA